MKKCPKCQSIVDAEYECKVCGESIFYEPYVNADREQIAKDRLLGYWLPKLKLPIAATITFIITLLVRWRLDKYALMTAVLVGLSWLAVIFKQRSVRAMLWKYNEDYARGYANAETVILPIAAILASMALLLVE